MKIYNTVFTLPYGRKLNSEHFFHNSKIRSRFVGLSMLSYIYLTVASFRDRILIEDFENTFSTWKTINSRNTKTKLIFWTIYMRFPPQIMLSLHYKRWLIAEWSHTASCRVALRSPKCRVAFAWQRCVASCNGQKRPYASSHCCP